MIALVLPSDFKTLPYLIPNVDKALVADQLTAFIAVEQEKMLKKLLGKLMYKALDEGLQVLPLDQRWIDLRDGLDYSDEDGDTMEYGGLKELLIPYIYSRWLEVTFDQHTDVGITIAETENSMVINPTDRIVSAYNEFVMLGGNCLRIVDTLYGYLYYSDTRYLDVVQPTFATIKDYMRNSPYKFKLRNVFSL